MTKLSRNSSAPSSAATARKSTLVQLTETRLTVLSDAARRGDGAATPPRGMKAKGAERLAATLIEEGLAREIRAKVGMPVWRRNEEGRSLALTITKTGRAAIGVADQHRAAEAGSDGAAVEASTGAGRSLPRQGSKLAEVTALLCRSEGARMEELISATGWLPHTTRAALTGLRKRGYGLERQRSAEGGSVYRIVSFPARALAALRMRGGEPRRQPAGRPAAATLEAELARLGGLGLEELRACWRGMTRRNPPKALSRDLLARMIACRIQERRLGKLRRETRLLLDRLATGGEPVRHLKVGTVMMREHQGQLHEVMVVPGGFSWRETTYPSLSTIARAITGTSWNGPRFFGLRGGGNAIEVREPVAAKLQWPASTRGSVRANGRALSEERRP